MYNEKKCDERAKSNLVVLINNIHYCIVVTLVLILFSFAILILFSHRGHKHAHRLTSNKEKKENSTVFFLSQRFNCMRKSTLWTFSFKLVLVGLFFIQVHISDLRLMTIFIIINHQV